MTRRKWMMLVASAVVATATRVFWCQVSDWCQSLVSAWSTRSAPTVGLPVAGGRERPPQNSTIPVPSTPLSVPQFGMVTTRGSVRRAIVRGSELRVVHAARMDETGRESFATRTSTDPTSSVEWIPAEEVILWDSAVVRPLAITFGPRTLPLTERAISSVEFATNGFPNDRPLARIPVSEASSNGYWPLLAEQTVSVRGAEHRVLRVSAQTIDDEADSAVRSAHEKFDIVIVIDNTHSSELFLAAARQAVMDLFHELSASHEIAVAIVLYRDYADGIYFGPNREVTQILGHGGLVSRRDEVLQLLRPISPAPYSSGEYAEALLDGLFVSLKNIPWREGSRRLIVQIGDSSSHFEESPKNPYRLTIAKITRLARERDVRIVPVVIEGAGGPDENRRHRRQAEELAAQTDGTVLETSDLPQLARRLLVLGGNTTTSTTPTIGWTPADLDGQPLFERGWLLSGKQLEFLSSELAGLVTTLRLSTQQRSATDSETSPPPDQIAEGRASRASLFFSQPHDETWAAMLRRAGVPVSLKRLHRTQRELLEMSPSEQHELAEHLYRDWLQPLRSLQHATNAKLELDVFVPVSLLP